VEEEVIMQRSLKETIRGWFPQEPIIGNKQLQIKLETNPLKLKQLKAKFTINIAQFIAVVLAVGLILGGLYLNSIYTIEDESSLPVSGHTYYEPFEYQGDTYNCSMQLSVPPEIRDIGFGFPNIAPIYVYINQPTNLTSGVYISRLIYLTYNASSDTYSSKEVNNTGTFSVISPERQLPNFSIVDLSIPFGQGQGRDPTIKNVGLTLYCNSTGDLNWPLFSITTPLDSTNIVYNYPYRTYATYLLTLGVISLIASLVIAFANLKKKSPNSLYNIIRS
jgi:hypothetical protein